VTQRNALQALPLPPWKRASQSSTARRPLRTTRVRRPVGSVAGCRIRKKQQCRDADWSRSRSGGGRGVRRWARAGGSASRRGPASQLVNDLRPGKARTRGRGGPWRAPDHLPPNCHPRRGQRLERVVASSVPRFWHAARTPAILRAAVRRQAQRPENRSRKPNAAPWQGRDSSLAPTGYSSHVAKSRATSASVREQRTA
jgi:hypothetical protein